MRIKVYHGTAADNLPSILENGFDGNSGIQLWDVSGGANYFWNPADLMEAERLDSLEEAQEMAKRRAVESAEIGLAKSKDCRRVVFEVELELGEFEKDNSCPNMDGAIVAFDTVPADRIKAIFIDSEDLSFFRPYFAALCFESDLKTHVDYTRAELAMIKAMKNSDLSCEIMETLSEMELVRLK